MKRLLFLQFVFVIGIGNILAQNTINGYQYWFDSDSVITEVSISSPLDSLHLDTSISVASLTDGLHTFNIRFLDDSSKFSSILSQFFFKKPNTSFTNKELDRYEIWYDNNYSNATSTTITSTAALNLNTSLNISSLTAGLHTVNYRCRDIAGNWSPVLSQFFLKKPENASTSTVQLTKYEVWFDNDFLNRTTMSQTASATIDLNTNINAQSQPAGLHTINMRFQDDNGQWSPVVSQFFMKLPETSIAAQELVAYEYWFNTDYANVNRVNISGTPNLNLLETVDVSHLPNGLHTLSVRFEDDIHHWSAPTSQFFFKKAATSNASSDIVLYRYWFDNEDENKVYQGVSPSQTNLDLMDNFDMTSIWKGMHTIHFQFKTEQGKWSVVTTDSIEKISLPIAKFNYTIEQYCDSAVVTFINSSIDGDTMLWDFGNGITSTEFEPSVTYSSTSTFDVSLTTTDTTLLSDSSITKSIAIEFLPISRDTIDVTECDSFISPSGNFVYYSTGTYYDTLVNRIGCDSILQIDLVINEKTYESVEIASCFKYISPSMKYVWTESGTYIDTISNVYSCDSIVTIDLTINTVDTGVSQSDNVLTADADNATYQWVDCNNSNAPIAGETNKVFTSTKNGDFAVVVTQNNCELMSDCYTVKDLGVSKNHISTNVVVYPNPTQGTININLNRNCTHISIELRDVSGKLISKQDAPSGSEFSLELDAAKGVYYVYVNTDQGRVTAKVLKE